MGTHDYDKIQGPITYEAKAPKDIKFRALKQTEELDCEQLFEVLAKDQKLKKYLHIIKDKPLYPVFYDATGQVLSLPPIINSYETRISHETKSVFIEMTGTDLRKLEVCLAVLAGQFSSHCEGESQFTIEQVEVVYPHGTIEVYPKLQANEFELEVEYINRTLGVKLNVD